VAGKTLPIHMLPKPQARRINIEHFIKLLPFIWRNYEDDEFALPGKQ